MHDIDRGGRSIAARLAALAALRHAQSDGGVAVQDQAGGPGRAGPPRRRANDGARASDDTSTPRAGPTVSPEVYNAVEAAVKKSRTEFVLRLGEYLAKLDCDALETAAAGGIDARLDEAQFIAHRISGVGRTLGFGDLGDTARQAEAAISAYKLERTPELRQTSIWRVCKLAELVAATCAGHDAPRD